MSVAAQTNVPRSFSRRLSIGAEIVPEGGVHFRVWAPDRKNVDVILESENHASGHEVCCRLQSENDGYFAGHIGEAQAGVLYRFRLDGGSQRYPDPASRFQPQGPHGPSEVIDPTDFKWTDNHWNGIGAEGQVLYEMHIGTFSKEGTWDVAERELTELADCGVTVLEVMPLADFPGRFGWGYDGVNLFAPTRLYGRPENFRHFVNRAHEVGLGVILDVVYNHLGPDGNYLAQYARDYFTNRYQC